MILRPFSACASIASAIEHAGLPKANFAPEAFGKSGKCLVAMSDHRLTRGCFKTRSRESVEDGGHSPVTPVSGNAGGGHEPLPNLKTATVESHLSQRHFRTINLDDRVRAAAVEDNVVRNVSVSSEEPYESYWGREILLHKPENVDLNRVKANAAPLLFNHDRSAFIGKISNPQLRDGKLYVDFRFGSSEQAKQCLADVRSGILTECSIGYSIEKYEVDEDEETVTATLWLLYEASLAPIPADFSVGVGRSHEFFSNRSQNMNEPANTIETPRCEHQPNENRRANQRTATQERERIRTITQLSQRNGVSKEVLDEAIENDVSIKAFCNYIREHVWKPKCQPIDTPVGDADLLGNRGLSATSRIGDQIVARRDFQEFAKKSSKEKRFSVELPNIVGIRMLTTEGSDLTGIDKKPIPVGLGTQALLVADLLGQGTTNQPTVRFIQEQTLTLSATAVGEGQTKPSANLDLQEKDSPVRKIAVTDKVSDELQEDFPQVMTFLNDRLGYMVGWELDRQLLFGDGLNNNLKGMLSTAGIQVQPKGTDTNLDAIFLGITAINAVGHFRADGVIIHPNTFAKLRLTKDLNNQYFGTGPFYAPYGNQVIQLQVPTLWGLPVAITTAIDEGRVLVGAFKQSAYIYWRRGLSLDMGYSDNDFQSNLISVRAELRATLCTVSPAGLCECPGIA